MKYEHTGNVFFWHFPLSVLAQANINNSPSPQKKILPEAERTRIYIFIVFVKKNIVPCVSSKLQFEK